MKTQLQIYWESHKKIMDKYHAIAEFRKILGEEILSGYKSIDEIAEEQSKIPERSKVFNSKDDLLKYMKANYNYTE